MTQWSFIFFAAFPTQAMVLWATFVAPISKPPSAAPVCAVCDGPVQPAKNRTVQNMTVENGLIARMLTPYRRCDVPASFRRF